MKKIIQSSLQKNTQSHLIDVKSRLYHKKDISVQRNTLKCHIKSNHLVTLKESIQTKSMKHIKAVIFSFAMLCGVFGVNACSTTPQARGSETYINQSYEEFIHPEGTKKENHGTHKIKTAQNKSKTKK